MTVIEQVSPGFFVVPEQVSAPLLKAAELPFATDAEPKVTAALPPTSSVTHAGDVPGPVAEVERRRRQIQGGHRRLRERHGNHPNDGVGVSACVVGRRRITRDGNRHLLVEGPSGAISGTLPASV